MATKKKSALLDDEKDTKKKAAAKKPAVKKAGGKAKANASTEPPATEPENGGTTEPADEVESQVFHPSKGGVYGNSKASVSEADINAAFHAEASRTKKILEKEEKVMVMIPLDQGEKEGATQQVSINGYTLNIKKGCMVKVPKSFAELIAESFRINLEVGKESRIDRDSGTQEALS